MKHVRVGNKAIGDEYPTFIIAEMAWSHDGSVKKAKKIIDAAVDARTDAICFHLTSMEDYMVPHYRTGKERVSAGKETMPIYEYLSSINLGEKEWGELFPYARKQGLIICVMCNDLPSAALGSELGADGYIISPASLCEEDLVKEVAGKKKPIFLRIGGAHIAEIERAIGWARKTGNDDIVLIHGFQSYPTKIENTYLRFISTLKCMFSLPVGFADHVDGSSELALMVPLVALAFGANVIEKHLTHDRSLRGEDFESALDPGDFKRFVRNLREIEKAFGSPFVKPLSKEELEYRKIVRKRAVASQDIKVGEKITRGKIAFKRSDEGVLPDESSYLIGRIATKDIKKNEPLTYDKVA